MTMSMIGLVTTMWHVYKATQETYEFLLYFYNYYY